MHDETRAKGPGPGKRGSPTSADALMLAAAGDGTLVTLRQAILGLSDALDASLRVRLAAWSQGYQAGREHGYDAGWAAAEDHGEREHQAVAAVVLETPQQSASRRLTAAMAGERRDQAEHWRKRWAELFRLSRDQRFTREAYATEPGKRSYDQAMALLLHAARTEAA